MVHVLGTLARLESRFDSLALHDSALVSNAYPGTSSTLPSARPLEAMQQTETGPNGGPPPTKLNQYEDLTVPHKVLLWPSIHAFVANATVRAVSSDMQHISELGTPWLIRQEMAKHPLPLPCGLGPSSSVPNRHLGDCNAYESPPPLLTAAQVQKYTDAYFDTFGVLYPILDQDKFIAEVAARVLREGYRDGDSDAVLALTVFALGQLAIEGTFGEPISDQAGVSSGFRGGSADIPPGIELFSEARRRLGFVVTSCTLENIQILLLQGTYYEGTAWHLEYWRCVVAASTVCQMLIRSQNIDWSSPYGIMMMQAYWACVLSEDLFHLDLDLPQTGIHALEDYVPLPYLQNVPDQEHRSLHDGDSKSHSEYHFLAMISLRRLITRIHDVVHGCKYQDGIHVALHS